MNEEMFRALMKLAVKMARGIKDDREALEVKCFYKQFESQIGRELMVGEYVQYGDKLYRVLTTHVAQANWSPNVSQSLFIVVDLEHEGTIEDPIPANANMMYYNGKYYIENDILYLCIRDSGIALQTLPSTLIGIYFELINNEEPKEDIPNDGGENIPNEEENGEENVPNEEEKGEEGTLENPIPAVLNMMYYNGKYYIENDVVYLCTRDSGIPLAYLPSALIGQYFKLVE